MLVLCTITHALGPEHLFNKIAFNVRHDDPRLRSDSIVTELAIEWCERRNNFRYKNCI